MSLVSVPTPDGLKYLDYPPEAIWDFDEALTTACSGSPVGPAEAGLGRNSNAQCFRVPLS